MISSHFDSDNVVQRHLIGQKSLTLTVIKKRLFSTISVACVDPHPSPFSGGNIASGCWLSDRRVRKLVRGLVAGSEGSTSSMLCSHGNRYFSRTCRTEGHAVWNLCVISERESSVNTVMTSAEKIYVKMLSEKEKQQRNNFNNFSLQLQHHLRSSKFWFCTILTERKQC